MVKTKRRLGATLIAAMLCIALAAGLFCFAGGAFVAFAEDEPAAGEITAEELSAVKGLWKVQIAADNAATPEWGTAQAFGSKVAYVADGKGIVGEKEDYYSYFAAGTTGTGDNAVTYSKKQQATLDLDAVVKTVTVTTPDSGGESTAATETTKDFKLSDYVNGNVTYENNVATGEKGNVTVVTSTAKFTTNGNKQIELTKEWAIVTEPAAYVVTSGTSVYKPLADGAHVIFGSATGSEIAEPQLVATAGVDTAYLHIEIQPNVKINNADNIVISDIILKKEGSDTKYYRDDGTHNIAQQVKIGSDGNPVIGSDGNPEMENIELTWADEIAYLFGGFDNSGTAYGAAQSGNYTMTFSLPSDAVNKILTAATVYAPWATAFELERIQLTEDEYKAEPVNGTIIYGDAPAVKIMKKVVSGEGENQTVTYVPATDVTFEYENRFNLNAGNQVPVVVHGTGNYDGKLTARFVINRKQNILSITFGSWDYGTFDATKNKISATATEGAETVYYTVKKKNAENGYDTFNDELVNFKLVNGEYPEEVAKVLENLDAGEYRLEAEIQEKEITNHTGIQYLHADNINGYPFEVHKARYALPTLTVINGVNDTYSGGELSMIIGGFDSRFMEVSFTGVRGQNGVLYAIDAGNYTATVTLNNDNCEWANGEESVTLNWTVSPKVITRPTDDRTDFTINGSNQTYSPVGFDDRYMTITGNVRDDAGTTVVTVELKDKKNFVWDNGTVDAISFGWHIDTADVAFAVTVCVLVALILVCLAVAVMQFISHRQRMTVFAEIGERQSAEPSEAKEDGADEPQNNEGGDR